MEVYFRSLVQHKDDDKVEQYINFREHVFRWLNFWTTVARALFTVHYYGQLAQQIRHSAIN